MTLICATTTTEPLIPQKNTDAVSQIFSSLLFFVWHCTIDKKEKTPEASPCKKNNSQVLHK